MSKAIARPAGTMLAPLRFDAGRNAAILRQLPATLLDELCVEGGLEAFTMSETGKRRRLWDLDDVLHCSILGTCLTTGDLRDIMGRIAPALRDRSVYTDYDIHHEAVLCARKPDRGGKMLHKALDSRFAGKIRQFAAAATDADLLRLWQAHLDDGDIPGAYWAAQSHPALTQEGRARIFGDVHMLSHMVGASNRADIRRLRHLEAGNAELFDETVRLRRSLQEIARAHEALEKELARERAAHQACQRRLERQPANVQPASVEADLALARERAEHATTALQGARSALAQERETVQALTSRLGQLQDELLVLEGMIAHSVEDDEGLQLRGRAILLVGGRTAQMTHVRAFIQDHGGQFLHHDGGMEQSCTQLPPMIGRADIILMPTDCVSHEAALMTKRTAYQLGRPFLPLARSGLGAIARALTSWQNEAAALPA